MSRAGGLTFKLKSELLEPSPKGPKGQEGCYAD